eukprot:m.139767 g.139767  ORF g.139767 m.139767 type:complete len:356 (-) comp30078_c0_seq1:47-1114(-)
MFSRIVHAVAVRPALLAPRNIARHLTAASAFQPATVGDDNTNILVTGALGQLGMELVSKLRDVHGSQRVLATDIRKAKAEVHQAGPYRYADVLDYKRLEKLIVEHNITQVVHLSALLSAVGEQNVPKALQINNIGTEHVFELARLHNLSVFCPSTIGAFGPTTPAQNTPDLTIMRPTTIYGVTKVYMEMLGEYYNARYGVDFRSLRLPGILSSDTAPGGGTTDYAVAIFHHAVTQPNVPFECYLRPDSALPMMMIDDCVGGIVQFMQADETQLSQRVYNLAAVSFTPAEIAAKIKERIPSFEIVYNPDSRQAIADSWPDSFDDSNARRDWSWKHSMDFDTIVDNMLKGATEFNAK